MSGCSNDGSKRTVTPTETPAPTVEPSAPAISQPTVSLPPDTGNMVLVSTFFNLEDQGYQANEFFVSGAASAFQNLSELSSDGKWDIEPGESAQYTTRAVVYRPIDPQAFSGTIIVEWLNVSAGFDNPPVWLSAHVEMLRRGHAWVGVSTQRRGIEGGGAGLLPLPFALKDADPERYATLSHPGDSYSYDIFSQVAQAIRSPQEVDLMGGLQAKTLIAAGQSQGAWTLATYINAIHPLHDAFDAYLMAARPVMSWADTEQGWQESQASGSAPLATEPLATIRAPAVVNIRTDIQAPVLMLQSETDVVALKSASLRQADSEYFRLWEVAGTSHADLYTTVTGQLDTGSDPSYAVIQEETSVFGFINCTKPMNAGPLPWLFHSALASLERWVRQDKPAPSAPRLELTDDSTNLVLDAVGNAVGGIRTPHVDAPAAILSGLGQEGESFCGLFGTTQLLSAEEMATRYVDKAGYRAAVKDSANDAVSQLFLLPEDAKRIKTAAGLQWDALMQP